MNIFDILKIVNSLSPEEKSRLASLTDAAEVIALAKEYGMVITEEEAQKALKYIQKYKDTLL